MSASAIVMLSMFFCDDSVPLTFHSMMWCQEAWPLFKAGLRQGRQMPRLPSLLKLLMLCYNRPYHCTPMFLS